jgi:hypothetical protein
MAHGLVFYPIGKILCNFIVYVGIHQGAANVFYGGSDIKVGDAAFTFYLFKGRFKPVGKIFFLFFSFLILTKCATACPDKVGVYSGVAGESVAHLPMRIKAKK